MLDVKTRGLKTRGLKTRGLRRWVADFALAFVLFWAAVLGLGAAHSRAYAVSLPVLVREVMATDAAPSSPASLRVNALNRTVGRSPIGEPETNPEHARLLLSLAFATLAAINLGFWRHLRRVYASPRRRVSRRS
jgi:hypothetical protein